MLSNRLLMGKVGRVRKLSCFFLCLCIGGGGWNALTGCSSHSSKASSLAQVETSRQTASQATNDQQREEPTSLETFSAFLDRG
jgi:hypothetical protein